MKAKIGIFLSGRGSNLQNIINAIENQEIDASISYVFSNKIDAYGLKIAEKYGIKTVSLSSTTFATNDEYFEEIYNLISCFSINFICLAGFMKIIPESFIAKFENKIINIHPSLLPSFKGKDGQKQAFDYGVKIAGCTVHYVVPEIDSGKIIAQAAITTEGCEDDVALSEKILKAEHYLYVYALQKLTNNKKITEKRINAMKDEILLY